MRTVQIVLLCLLAIGMSLAADIINVNAGLTPGETENTAPAISPLLYGHNIRWVEGGDWLCDANGGVKPSVLPIIREAAWTRAATLRFPGGHWNDDYRWRRGVGPQWKRPMEKVYYSDYCDHYNTFGTDEAMAFARAISPSTKLMVGVNWWAYNRPVGSMGSPTGGMQMAANWVEYCNGDVNTVVTRLCGHCQQYLAKSVLEWAAHEAWEPSQFRVEGVESTECDAAGYADLVHSWKSTDIAPQGYFAWLRYHFAQLAGKPDPGPYGIQYWEIDNEVYLDDLPSIASVYRDGVTAYSRAMKEANSQTHTFAVDDSYDLQEANPYAGNRIKVGAVLGGIWDEGSDAHNAWDHVVLTSDTAKFIDFMVVHPYCVAYPDEHYSARRAVTRIATSRV